MEADCRLTKRLLKPSTRCSSITKPSPFRTKYYSNFALLTFLLMIIAYHLEPVCSLVLDCDSVKNCICSRDDGGWRIECPNAVYSRYPIELQVNLRPNDNNTNEASLRIECDDQSENKLDPWSYITDMDLSPQQVYATITKLDINYCPPVQDGWKKLLKQVNLKGDDIRQFNFIMEQTHSNVEIPSNFFDNLPNIEILILTQNKLTTIPDLSGLKNLKGVNLRSNDIQDIPPNAFANNPQLDTIRLNSNQIRDIPPGTFPRTLEHLELNNNPISRLNSSVFANLTNLKRLYLIGNPLDDLDSNVFDDMPALKELRLDNSKMVQYPDFNNLPSLVNLTISNGIRYTILSGEGALAVTTTLPPEYLPENTLVLKDLPSLENLDLTLNHFTSLPRLENLPKLRSIDLKRNQFRQIESGAFAGLPGLKVLNLARNKISKIGTIRAQSLVELDLSKNLMTEVQNDTFKFLTSLKKLSLAYNQIQNVRFKAMDPLSALEELDMSHNQVTFSYSPYAGVTDNLLGDAFGLGNLSPLRSSIRLKRLRLSHNNIAKLAFSDWTLTFTEINEIDLSFNKIKHVTANEFNFVSPNITLNLENNEISVVDLRLDWILKPEDSLSGSKETRGNRVFLSGNPLNCDCLAYRLKAFSSEYISFQFKDLTCETPSEFKGRKLIEVPDTSLVCDFSELYMEQSGCPTPCMCKERTVDKTVMVDCAGKNLTNHEIPLLNNLTRGYRDWDVELDLSDNEITDFNSTSPIKQFLNKTKLINLSGNRLTSTLFLEKLEDYQPTKFAIADNPFPCSNCAGFQTPWRAYSVRISDLANVTCQREAGDTSNRKYDVLLVKEIKDLGEFCTSRLSAFVVPLVIAVIFLSCLCIGLFVTIKYGWGIKAYLYSKGWDWCLFWETELDDEDDGNEKLYDAFVSYSHKDEEWVVDELVHRLEENEGFKLCVHFRDWTPGDWIPDQIVKSVDKSRRTIVVLSKNFVESVWSRLEFKAAHAQALKERSNRVILILLGEDLKECDVQDDDLKMYMKMNTFMKWNDPLFWHRLKYALPHKKTTVQTDEKQHVIKMQQRERAIKLDKLRAKLEQNV